MTIPPLTYIQAMECLKGAQQQLEARGEVIRKASARISELEAPQIEGGKE